MRLTLLSEDGVHAFCASVLAAVARYDAGKRELFPALALFVDDLPILWDGRPTA